jgi:hypothetical protein
MGTAHRPFTTVAKRLGSTFLGSGNPYPLLVTFIIYIRSLLSSASRAIVLFFFILYKKSLPLENHIGAISMFAFIVPS